MQNRIKTLLIVLVIAAVAAGAVYFYIQKKQGTGTSQNPNSGEVSTGSGGVGTLPPLQTTTGRNLPVAHVDSSRPFAVNLPRSNEPSAPVNTNPQSNQPTPSSIVSQKLSEAVNQGLIPDKDGLYVQNVDPSGISKYDSSRYNYSLSPNQFATSYYPDFQSVAQNGQVPAPGSDQVLQDNSRPAPLVTSVPTVQGIDTKLFNVSSADSQQAYTKYFNNLQSSMAPVDLVSSPTTVSEIAVALNDNPQAMAAYKQETDTILSQLKSMPVPRSMLGVQEAYYMTYTLFDAFLNDNINYSNAVASGDKNSSQYLDRIQLDSSLLASSLTSTIDQLDVASQVIQGKGIAVPTSFPQIQAQ